MAHSILSNDPIPGDVVRADSSIEVTKNDELVRFRNSSNGRVKFLIEFELHFIRVGHSGSIGTDDDKMLPSKREGEFHGHKPVVHSIGRSSQLANKGCLHCNANTSLTSLFTSSATPKEGVARAPLIKLAFSCKPGLTQGCDVDVVSGEFLSNQSGFPLRFVRNVSVQECAHVPCAKGERNNPRLFL